MKTRELRVLKSIYRIIANALENGKAIASDEVEDQILASIDRYYPAGENTLFFLIENPALRNLVELVFSTYTSFEFEMYCSALWNSLNIEVPDCSPAGERCYDHQIDYGEFSGGWSPYKGR